MGAERVQGTSLVIGSGGLLGRSVAHHLKMSGSAESVICPTITWSDPSLATTQLQTSLRSYLTGNEHRDSMEIYWCAGIATQRTVGNETELEQHFLHQVLSVISSAISQRPVKSLRLFFASSAGGVYGDTRHSVASETNEPRPQDSYGNAKLDLELRLRQFAKDTSTSVVIGRLSSLYGRRQNMQKRQGLLSHLAVAIAKSQPIEIFTSLSSTRNYLDSDSAARIAVDQMRRLVNGEVRLRNICAPYNVSVAELLSLSKQLAGRNLRIIQTGHSQPSNSRIVTMFSSETASLTRMTMAEGLSSLVRAARRDTLQA